MLANNEMQKLYSRINGTNIGILDLDSDRELNGVYTRSKIVNILVIILLSIICVRLIYINWGMHQFLNSELTARIERTVKQEGFRGVITDRNNIPLAISTNIDSIWANPRELNELNSEQIKLLSQILNISMAKLNDKLNDKSKTFVYLKRSVSPEIAKQIKQLKINGIYDLDEFKRYYPNGEVSAHLVGFTNIDDMGSDGIEYAVNQNLLGSDGNDKVIINRKGHQIGDIGDKVDAKNGENIQLSIDNRIQFIAYNALKSQFEKSQAKSGSAVVLDAKTGEVLAMVNMPTYNPNNRANVSIDVLKNRAVTNVFDPGSIMKPLVISKALQDKLVQPQTVFDTTPYTVGGKLIKDDHPQPSMNVAEILKLSSDIGTSKIALKYKARDLWSYYHTLGLGQKLDTGFPGETSGILRDWKKWYPIDQALMSYGYGISVSLFQMARAYTIFTNDGCILPVTFYKITDNHTPHCNQVISPRVASVMRGLLSDVATDGTGKNAQTANYTVAGKTGTAQKLDGYTYSNKKHIGSFVGYAPATNPKIIVAVMIDEVGKGSYYGGSTAAPVFSEIVANSLRELGVATDLVNTTAPIKIATLH